MNDQPEMRVVAAAFPAFGDAAAAESELRAQLDVEDADISVAAAGGDRGRRGLRALLAGRFRGHRRQIVDDVVRRHRGIVVEDLPEVRVRRRGGIWLLSHGRFGYRMNATALEDGMKPGPRRARLDWPIFPHAGDSDRTRWPGAFGQHLATCDLQSPPTKGGNRPVPDAARSDDPRHRAAVIVPVAATFAGVPELGGAEVSKLAPFGSDGRLGGGFIPAFVNDRSVVRGARPVFFETACTKAREPMNDAHVKELLCHSASGGGRTAGMRSDSIHSSRAQPIVW